MSDKRPAGYFLPPAWLLPLEAEVAARWEHERVLNRALTECWKTEGIRLREHLDAELGRT